MSLEQGSFAYADEINELKARIKEEMLRRQYVGSVANYGGTAYDYTVTPSASTQTSILAEHWNKIIEPMNAVKGASYKTAATAGSTIIEALDDISTTIEALSSIGQTASVSGCVSSCTGLCSTSATGGSSCSSGCTSGCSTNCSSTCGTSSNCSSSCATNCAYGCVSTCSGTCRTACGYSCSYNTT